jgi:hypothetical protein
LKRETMLTFARGAADEGWPDEGVGDAGAAGAIGGNCMEWEDDRLKKGIDEGVNRFEEGPARLKEDDGLRET